MPEKKPFRIRPLADQVYPTCQLPEYMHAHQVLDVRDLSASPKGEEYFPLGGYVEVYVGLQRRHTIPWGPAIYYLMQPCQVVAHEVYPVGGLDAVESETLLFSHRYHPLGSMREHRVLLVPCTTAQMLRSLPQRDEYEAWIQEGTTPPPGVVDPVFTFPGHIPDEWQVRHVTRCRAVVIDGAPSRVVDLGDEVTVTFAYRDPHTRREIPVARQNFQVTDCHHTRAVEIADDAARRMQGRGLFIQHNVLADASHLVWAGVPTGAAETGLRQGSGLHPLPGADAFRVVEEEDA